MRITGYILLILFAGSGKLHAQTYKLKGKIGSWNAPAMLFLKSYSSPFYSTPDIMLDSVELRDGHFSFSGKIKEPTRACLVLRYPDKVVARKKETYIEDGYEFYLEKGTTTFSSPDSISATVSKGSAATIDHYELLKRLQPVQYTFDLLWESRRYWQERPRSEEETGRYINHIRKENRGFNSIKLSIISSFIEKKPSSPVILDVLNREIPSIPDPSVLEPMYAALSSSIKQSTKGKAFDSLLKKLWTLQIGNYAPGFSIPDSSGNLLHLSDYKGKYLLLDFWASYCGACRREYPHFKKLYNQYKEKGLEILGVSFDQKDFRDKWIKAIIDDNLSWPQGAYLVSKGEKDIVHELYRVRSIPQNYLIDPSGKIIAINIKWQDLDNKLAQIFKPEDKPSNF